MTTRDRSFLLLSATTMALLLFGAPNLADADSRRHVFKPGQNPPHEITTTFGDAGSGGGAGSENHAPEIDGVGLGLGLALALGGVAMLTSRRRFPAA